MARWRNRIFQSYHHQPSGEWLGIWRATKSTNPEDYPLTCRDGVYTMQARAVFLSYIIDHESEIWPDDILKQVGELQGVCAFISPQEALTYGRESLVGKYDLDKYVEFEGEYLCEAPEYQSIIARVIIPEETIYDSSQFAERHGLSLSF